MDTLNPGFNSIISLKSAFDVVAELKQRHDGRMSGDVPVGGASESIQRTPMT